MYNALIVDDERIIRNGLLKMPVWHELDIHVWEARNGLEALERLKQQPFDILVTDIRMPGVNGLSLIEEAVKRYPQIQIAVLSGHTQFEYAQAALRFGVQNYLLKPVSQQEFRHMLETMLEHLCKLEQTKRAQTAKQQEMALVRRRSQDAALEQYLLGACDAEEFLPDWLLDDQLVELILVIPEESMQETAYSERIAPVLKALQHALTQVMPPLAILSVMGNVVVVGNAHPSMFGEVTICMQEFCRRQSPDEPPVATVCRTQPQGARSLQKLYQQARSLADYRFYKEGLAVLDIAEPSGDVCPSYVPVLEALERKDVSAAQRALTCFLEQIATTQPPVQETKDVCMKLYHEIVQQLGEEEQILGRQITEMLAFGYWRRFDVLKQFLFQLLAHAETVWMARKLQSYSPVVRKAILYVREHLAEDELTQGNLAGNVLFINPDYFGRLFRKETGIPFTQYLLGLRMQKARMLIEQNPEIRVAEVCEQVGYGANPQYFSQIFRQHFGCAPSEYKRMVEQNNE